MTDTLNRPFNAAPEGPVPPQALDAERSVLAAMMLDHEAVGRAVEMLLPEVFYRLAHQKIFQAILALYETNTKADLVTLGEELRKRGDLEAVGGNPRSPRSSITPRPRRTSSTTRRSSSPSGCCAR